MASTASCSACALPATHVCDSCGDGAHAHFCAGHATSHESLDGAFAGHLCSVLVTSAAPAASADKYNVLQEMLDKTSIYSTILSQQIAIAPVEPAPPVTSGHKGKGKPKKGSSSDIDPCCRLQV